MSVLGNALRVLGGAEQVTHAGHVGILDTDLLHHLDIVARPLFQPLGFKEFAFADELVEAAFAIVREQGLEAARAYIEETAERIDEGEAQLNTEGAIAKYLASEAGNAAADAAIQAHGGYGYTKEYMVEKIKRDVRITTIYEGTSEIMEMTIARDRWQQHLKTDGSILLGDPTRTMTKEFIHWIRERGWLMNETTRNVPQSDRPIRLIELRHDSAQLS